MRHDRTGSGGYLSEALNARLGHAQPNVPGRGIVASYSLRFWGLVVAIGVATGLAGAALIALLRLVQHLAWSYHSGQFLAAVERSLDGRRVLVLLAGGVRRRAPARCVLARARRRRRGVGGDLAARRAAAAVAEPRARGALDRRRRPGRVARARGRAAAGRRGVRERARRAQRACPSWQRRLLVACGAGAGMAAVYNVPLGGALFALEVLLGTLTLPLVLPALATTTIATAVAWVVAPDERRPT